MRKNENTQIVYALVETPSICLRKYSGITQSFTSGGHVGLSPLLQFMTKDNSQSLWKWYNITNKIMAR